MNTLVGFALLLAFVVFLRLVLAKINKPDDEGDWPFYSKRAMSPVELQLYRRLVAALPQNMVLPQVGLSRILGVKKGNNFGRWFNRINRMSADFVLCAADATVIAVIELDDASHQKPERRMADQKKDRALRSAGIRVIRWPVKGVPDDASIRALFSTNLAVDPSLKARTFAVTIEDKAVRTVA